MSLPSASSKRKRSNKLPDHAEMDQDLTVQTESRDASGEEGDTTAPESGRQAPLGHKKSDSGVGGRDPPSKRQRANSTQTAGGCAALDPGEPSDTTEASVDIAERVTRKSRKSGREQNGNGVGSNDAANNIEAGAAADPAMPPPPIGKLTHPVGYSTNAPPVGRPVRVYADGVFDLFHLGHMRQLEQAKKAFPNVYLMVGVTGDEETHKRKGLTVLTGKERAETVRHCKWVDEVVEDCPWIVTPGFMEERGIDYVAHDDLPYGADEGDDIYASIKAQGKFLVTQRTEGVSTTGIITKIVRDYEKYIARQLKRGTSRQELNVSWLKKNELDLKRHVQDLRDNIRTNWTTTGQELSRELRQFWPTSRSASPARPAVIVPNGEIPSSPLAPGSASAASAFATSPTGPARSPSLFSTERTSASVNDFIQGYSLGLIGGVRSWMTKSRRSVREDGSRQPSDDDSEEQDDKATAGDSRLAVPKTSTASCL